MKRIRVSWLNVAGILLITAGFVLLASPSGLSVLSVTTTTGCGTFTPYNPTGSGISYSSASSWFMGQAQILSLKVALTSNCSFVTTSPDIPAEVQINCFTCPAGSTTQFATYTCTGCVYQFGAASLVNGWLNYTWGTADTTIQGGLVKGNNANNYPAGSQLQITFMLELLSSTPYPSGCTTPNQGFYKCFSKPVFANILSGIIVTSGGGGGSGSGGSTTPDYTISTSATTVNITPGSSQNVTITLNAINGFTGTIALSTTVSANMIGGACSILPGTVTLSSTPSTIQSTLTVTATGIGSFICNVQATSGSLSHSLSVVSSTGSPTGPNLLPTSVTLAGFSLPIGWILIAVGTVLLLLGPGTLLNKRARPS